MPVQIRKCLDISQGVSAGIILNRHRGEAMTPQVDEPKAGATVANAGTPGRTVRITKDARYREVLAILARHGIAVVDEEFVKHEAGDRARAEHLRLACEQLGPVFIKLGQFLSTRGDLLPDVYRTELARLQDEVVPLPGEAIAEVIREDLGAPPEQLFASFDREPLGSASIAQVHAARLVDGRDVVLKVRKPGVDELVQIDLEILNDLVRSWTPRFQILRQYDAPALAREFADDLREELDYTREAANIKFFRDLFATEPGFTVPAVVQECSKNRVLTEERVWGRKTTDLADLPARLRAVVSHDRAIQCHDPSGGVHRGTRRRHAVLPPARMASLDCGRVLGGGRGSRHRFSANAAGSAKVSDLALGAEMSAPAKKWWIRSGGHDGGTTGEANGTSVREHPGMSSTKSAPNAWDAVTNPSGDGRRARREAISRALIAVKSYASGVDTVA